MQALCSLTPAETSVLSWPPAPSEVRLGSDEIHLWSASLGDLLGDLSRFQAVLSRDERVRASKFHSSTDRDRFVVCRGILRQLLARYLDRDAAWIEFCYGRFGKPDVTAAADDSALYFNASHSGTLALFAVTAACPVGVDVERLATVPDFELIASRFFAPSETSRLMALPPDKRTEAFFAYWTCKEAVLKATGEGIGRDLMAVHIDTDEHARVLHIGGDSHIVSDWHLQQLWPASGFLGAVAYKRDAARLSVWRVSDTNFRFTVSRSATRTLQVI